MKRLVMFALLALLIAGCAGNQARPRPSNGYGYDDAAWECHKMQIGWGAGKSCGD